ELFDCRLSAVGEPLLSPWGQPAGSRAAAQGRRQGGAPHRPRQRDDPGRTGGAGADRHRARIRGRAVGWDGPWSDRDQEHLDEAAAAAAASLVMPAVFPDDIEVQVFATTAGATLVAAIELVSPGNKDREEARRAFAAKCAGYLTRGVGLVVVDVVT